MSDRVKQTLFAILEPDLPGARFLDLCAGSGAGGIEALSRGAAAAAVMVEQDRTPCRTIAENLAHTGLAGPVGHGRPGRCAGLAAGSGPGRSGGAGPFDLVLVDPPYDQVRPCSAASSRSSAAIVGRADGGLLAPDATVVAKHFWRAAPPARIGLLRSTRERRFGETTLTFYRRVGTEDG